MLHGDCADLPTLVGENTAACIVTSPPYNAGMDYPGQPDDRPLPSYLADTRRWADAMAETLMPGGRLWLNVPPTMPDLVDGGRWSPMTDWSLSLQLAGLEYRDTIVWHQNVPDQATAWGSWLSPNAPNLRGRWEAVLVFFKDRWSRFDAPTTPSGFLSATEFTEWTRNVWDIPPARRSGGHPCPMPVELVRRAVLLSTWPDELVVDPFAGSGTTLRVAHQLGRRAVGVDASQVFVDRFAESGVQEVLA